MRFAFLLFALPLAALAAPASAQWDQTSVRLNDPTTTGRYLSVTEKTGLQGNAAYTLEAWVHPTVPATLMTIIGNNYQTSFYLGIGNDGRLLFYPRTSVFVVGKSVIPTNTWTHVAATYDATTGWALYVNGQLDSSGTAVTGVCGTDPGDLRIGADRYGPTPAYFWRGYLDEVRIWSEKRTVEQIRSTLYAGAGRPFMHSSLYSQLRGNWDMQQPATTLFFDRAGGLAEPYNLADIVGGMSVDVLSTNGPPVAHNVGFDFNGLDNYGVLPMGDGFDSGLTAEAWVYPRSYPAAATIVGRGSGSSFWLGLNSSGQVRFIPRGAAGGTIETGQSVPLRRFTHVAATYRDGVAHVYLNGRYTTAYTSVTGPVGENGMQPWFGADHSASGVVAPFDGILDEVRVFRGVRSWTQIREGMFEGHTGQNSTFSLPDEWGTPRECVAASADGFSAIETFGTNARLVRSGAPMFAGTSTVLFEDVPGDMPYSIPASGYVPPDTFTVSGIGTDLWVPLSQTVSDVDVFVSAMTTDLSAATLTVRSPAGTVVDLVRPGDGRGRDLQTAFSDEWTGTLASADPPYTDGVQPSEPLSTFDGEAAYGFWRLEMYLGAGNHLALNAWGVRVNGLTLGVPGGDAVALGLRQAGRSPVRGVGQLEFGLAREADVRLSLHDVAGRRIRDLCSGRRSAGEYHVSWSAADLAAGLYFVTLTADGRAAGTLKVTVLR